MNCSQQVAIPHALWTPKILLLFGGYNMSQVILPPVLPVWSTSVIFSRCATRIFKTCNIWLLSQGHWPLFPLDCQIKNDNCQHNNSHSVWINQNYTLFFLSCWQNVYFFGVLQIFSNLFMCALRYNTKGRKLLVYIFTTPNYIFSSLSLAEYLAHCRYSLNICWALPGVAQWIEHQPTNWKVAPFGSLASKAHAWVRGQVLI